MTRNQRIGIGIGMILVITLLITVLNKRWWIKQIGKRWQTTKWIHDDVLNRLVLDTEGYDTGHLEKYSLASLMRDYFQGSEGWTRQGEAIVKPDDARTPFEEGIVDLRTT
jgi:hypothetical protein